MVGKKQQVDEEEIEVIVTEHDRKRNHQLDLEHQAYIDQMEPRVEEYNKQKEEIKKIENLTDSEKNRKTEELRQNFYTKNGFYPENSETVLGSVKKWLHKKNTDKQKEQN